MFIPISSLEVLGVESNVLRTKSRHLPSQSAPIPTGAVVSLRTKTYKVIRMIVPILHPYLHTFLPCLFQRLGLELALFEELVVRTDIHQNLGFASKLGKKRRRVVVMP